MPPSKIKQIYTKTGKKLKKPKIYPYTTKKAHNLTYNSIKGAKTYKIIYKKK